MKNTTDRVVALVVVATGVASVVGQLLTIREFMAQFSGNEFVIALILFVWLVAGGLGTATARLACREARSPTPAVLAGLSLAAAGLLPVQLLAIRFLRDRMFLAGASVGFYPTLGFVAALVTPYALLIGFLLPYSLFVLSARDALLPAARVYILDNLGDVAGGALFAFVLVHWTTPMPAVCAANLPLALVAALLGGRSGGRPAAWIGGGVGVLLLLAGGIALETRSLAPAQGRLAFYGESRYGRLTVHQDGGQFTLFRDGRPTLSSYDPAGAEEAVHYPLAGVPDPRRVLVIGGAAGVLAELAKYRLEAVDYVEIDPLASRLQFRFGLLRPIEGLRVVHRDGRGYLAGTSRRYDAIIVQLPEPETFQLNRFYTDRFFRIAAGHLAPGGVLSFAVAGYENYLGEIARQKVSSLYRTARTAFAHVRLVPGQRVFFLCRQRPVALDIPGRLAARGIETLYVGPYFHGNVTAARIAALESLVDPDAPLNTDTRPRLVRLMFAEWFAKFAASPAPFVGGVLMLALAYLRRMTAGEYVLFTTGAMVMGGEILVIFAFQMAYGYVYHQIGLIVTAFLAGLLPGALFGDRLKARFRPVLALGDTALILLVGVFAVGVHFSGGGLHPAWFLVYGLLVSVACGFQFPAAVHMRGSDRPAAAGAFAADLVGAAAGTLATSVVLIPYLGVVWTAGLLAALKLSSLLVIARTDGTPHPTPIPGL